MSLPHHRTYSLILHGSGPAVVSVFMNNSLQAVSGVKHVLLVPWEITLLALSLGRLLGKYIWTALQSIIEGRPTQIPVQPPSLEEPAWMGRLRSIHSFCEFNILFFIDMDWEAFTSWHPKTPWRPNNETAESLCCVWLISLWPCLWLPLNCAGLCVSALLCFFLTVVLALMVCTLFSLLRHSNEFCTPSCQIPFDIFKRLLQKLSYNLLWNTFHQNCWMKQQWKGARVTVTMGDNCKYEMLRLYCLLITAVQDVDCLWARLFLYVCIKYVLFHINGSLAQTYIWLVHWAFANKSCQILQTTHLIHFFVIPVAR